MKISVNIFFFLLLSYFAQGQNYKSLKEVKGSQIGDSVNDFTAINQNNQIFKLSEALKNGPVVLLFYRGQWCPVCNLHLKNLQDSLQLIYNRGASVVAVSPEKPEYLNKTVEKTGAKFTLLYDEGYKISDAFDVTFLSHKTTLFAYNLVGANLKNAQSDDSERLPVPATFIISKNSKIIWRQFNPHYKIRASVKDILRHLPQ